MNLINNKYSILNKIGSGTFGTVYKGQNIRTKELVAIKVERMDEQLKLLKNESIMYQYLKDCDGIPDVRWFGNDGVNYYMVINLLGKSLGEMRQSTSLFSLNLVLKIGAKILSILKTIHEKGIVHRDIKPDNFLFGVDDLNKLYLIDFGFCKSYLEDGRHVKMKPIHNIIGSINYASIWAHNRCQLSRRDDLESLCYVLLFLFRGKLPWQDKTDETEIWKLKNDITNHSIGTDCPKVILDFLIYVRGLEYEETPNYERMIDMFKREIK